MSYHERRAIVSVLSNVLATGLYTAFMMQRYPQADAYAPEIFHFWGAFFLILIPVSIVARVVVHIIFSILNTIATHEMEPALTDERDKLIELKAARIALYVFAIGTMLAMGTLVVGMPPAAMFAVLICAGVGSDMVSEIVQFVLYRRGF
ncbi:MAG: DUF2178 domain-containing protein [Anaerolineae bacterium]